MAQVIGICKTILDVVRTLIRDLITDTLAKIVMILLRYPPPAYPAAMAGEGVPLAVKEGGKMVEQCGRLARAFARAKEFLGSLGDFFRRVVVAVGTAGKEMFDGFAKAAA